MTVTRARALLAALPLAIAACGGASSKTETGGAAAAATPKHAVIAADDMVMGAKDAPVTIVEYASLTCPHCATFHAETLPGLKEKYIDTGKVKFVFREFPTQPAMLAVAGALVARCAAEKGGPDAYFLLTGTLFRTQKTWISQTAAKEELQKVAAQAGMDQAAFDACLKRQDLLDSINARITEASEKFSVDSTPTFFLDGEELPGSITGEDFAKRLDAAIAKAKG